MTNFSPCAKAIKVLNKIVSFTGRLIIISNDRTGMTIRLFGTESFAVFLLKPKRGFGSSTNRPPTCSQLHNFLKDTPIEESPSCHHYPEITNSPSLSQNYQLDPMYMVEMAPKSPFSYNIEQYFILSTRSKLCQTTDVQLCKTISTYFS